MPIYEYKCLDCGAHVERMQKVSDEPLATCEVCSGKLEKQWSLSGFQFKGAGWYVTDYSSKLKDSSAENTKKTEKADSGETAKTDDAKKNSAAESTAKTEPASNKTNDNASSAKTDAVSKKE
jgi:putative FmdB family regulatory protein